jgi:hypothetical protein
LFKDTTNAFGVIQPGVNAYQTFNKDGSSIILHNADTISIYTYALAGKVLTVYPNADHNSYLLYGITSLDATNMELEQIDNYSPPLTAQLPAAFGLDPAASYKIITDDYYTKD